MVHGHVCEGNVPPLCVTCIPVVRHFSPPLCVTLHPRPLCATLHPCAKIHDFRHKWAKKRNVLSQPSPPHWPHAFGQQTVLPAMMPLAHVGSPPVSMARNAFRSVLTESASVLWAMTISPTLLIADVAEYSRNEPARSCSDNVSVKEALSELGLGSWSRFLPLIQGSFSTAAMVGRSFTFAFSNDLTKSRASSDLFLIHLRRMS